MNTYSKVKQNMQNLGVYKPEFDEIVHVYADLLDEYKKAKKEKMPAYKMDGLYRHIKAYAETLRLTPKTLTNGEEEKPKSKLDAVLENVVKLQNRV